MLLRLALLGVIAQTLAGPTPPAGALIVGGNGQYKTIQSAVQAASPGKIIFVNPGTYNEQVFVEKKDITIIGAASGDSYSGNKVTITYGLGADKAGNNDKSATLRAHGDGFKLYNVDVVNSRGKGIQALALSAYGDNQGYYGCSFKGFQDTILSEKGHHIFVKNQIIGATDFIFGQHALAWFEQCDIRVVSADRGWVTANGRDSDTNPSFYVINKSDIAAAGGNNVPGGAYYLGRPWRQYSRVVFQNTKMSGVINAAGWSIWNKGDEKTGNVYFGEYGNSGAGAGSKRAPFAKKLSSAVSINEVLPGHEKWVDKHYLP